MSLRDEFRDMYLNEHARAGLLAKSVLLGKHWWRDRQRKREMPRIGQLLLAQGDVTAADLDHALGLQRASGKRLGEILLAEGIISRRQLSTALRRQDRVSAAFTALLLSLAHTTAADAEIASLDSYPQPLTRTATLGGAAVDHAAARQKDIQREAASEAAAEARAVFGASDRRGRSAPQVNVTLRGNQSAPRFSDLVDKLPIHASFKPRVKAVMPDVRKASKEFNVPVELILAIIHTESGFREKATTEWKAVGLMQVVALSGGAEAIRYIKGRKGFPSHNALLTASSNIRIGTAYIRSLEDRHFSFIRSPEVRRAAVIAAYNQGPTKIRRILKKHGVPKDVAGMQTLLKKYSVKQTYDYLARVERRSQIYRPVADLQIASAR